MFFEQLSDLDKSLIESMRHWGLESCEDSGYVSEEYYTSIENFLRFWEYNKKERMSKVFGEHLILKKKINILAEDDELCYEMEELFNELPFTEIPTKIRDMLSLNNDIHDFTIKPAGALRPHSIAYFLEKELFCAEALINNKYQGPTLELKMPSGSIFKLVNGCKAVKAIGRLAKEAGITDIFESFRIRQSQIMNDAKLSAHMCLSIHPLDYMTASYNDNNWHSCMNWENGDYRRGVIEMMNSPYVIVAYLESAHNNLSFWIDGERKTWNSKKWREFIIVSDEGIFGIKGYPFWNQTLEAAALEWVRDLFSTEDMQFSSKVTKWKFKDYYNKIDDPSVNSSVSVEMVCGPAMYNDFYGGNEYQAVLRANYQMDNYISINYSGESECVSCGDAEGYFSEPSSLGCEKCTSHCVCSWCGDIISEDDAIYMQDGTFCHFCYEHNVPRCDCCGDFMPIDVDNDCQIIEDEGLSFYIEDDETGAILKDEQDIFPLMFNVCEDCADDIFVEGKDEFFKDHIAGSGALYGRYTNVVPFRRIKNIKTLTKRVSPLVVKLFLAEIEIKKQKQTN